MKNKKINSIIAFIVVLLLPAVAYLLLQTTGKTTDPTRTTANITYRGGPLSTKNQSSGSFFGGSGTILDYTENYSSAKVSPSTSKPQYGTSVQSLQSSASGLQSSAGKNISILGSGSTSSSAVVSGGVSVSGGSSASQYGSSKSVSSSSSSSSTTIGSLALSSAKIDVPFSSSDVSSNEANTRLDGGPGYNEEPPVGSVLWLLFLALPYVFVKLLIIKD
ncbi:MAG: hypothetical protein R3Y59_09820 [bacterium]